MRTAVHAARLRDLVFVVGEDEIVAAAVDVKGLAEQGSANRRAFDVPARSPAPPGAGEGGVFRLVCLGRFPEHKVGGVALARVHGDPRSALQVF